MGVVKDAVFGGSAKKAAAAQTRGLEKAAFEYKKGVQEAKREVKPLFAEANAIRAQRAGQAASMLKDGFSPSVDVLSQSNMNAQQALAGAAPQMQNAILGNEVDYGALQPQGLDFDPSQFLSGLTSMAPPEASLQAQMSPPPSPNQGANFNGGGIRFDQNFNGFSPFSNSRNQGGIDFRNPMAQPNVSAYMGGFSPSVGANNNSPFSLNAVKGNIARYNPRVRSR